MGRTLDSLLGVRVILSTTAFRHRLNRTAAGEGLVCSFTGAVDISCEKRRVVPMKTSTLSRATTDSLPQILLLTRIDLIDDTTSGSADDSEGLKRSLILVGEAA